MAPGLVGCSIHNGGGAKPYRRTNGIIGCTITGLVGCIRYEFWGTMKIGTCLNNCHSSFTAPMNVLEPDVPIGTVEFESEEKYEEVMDVVFEEGCVPR